MPRTDHNHNEIHTRIHHLRTLTPTLHEIATKRVNLAHSVASNTASAPTPINLTALDLLNQLEALARLLCASAKIDTTGHHGVQQLLAMLDDDTICRTLAERRDTKDIIRLLDTAIRHATILTDPDPTKRYIGVCATCGYGLWIADTDTLPETIICSTCYQPNHTRTVIQAHQLMLRTAGTVDTAANLATLLKGCGYPARRKTISEWKRRGKLTAVGEQDGKPLYALTDVLALLGADGTN